MPGKCANAIIDYSDMNLFNELIELNFSFLIT